MPAVMGQICLSRFGLDWMLLLLLLPRGFVIFSALRMGGGGGGDLLTNQPSEREREREETEKQSCRASIVWRVCKVRKWNKRTHPHPIPPSPSKTDSLSEHSRTVTESDAGEWLSVGCGEWSLAGYSGLYPHHHHALHAVYWPHPHQGAQHVTGKHGTLHSHVKKSAELVIFTVLYSVHSVHTIIHIRYDIFLKLKNAERPLLTDVEVWTSDEL